MMPAATHERIQKTIKFELSVQLMQDRVKVMARAVMRFFRIFGKAFRNLVGFPKLIQIDQLRAKLLVKNIFLIYIQLQQGLILCSDKHFRTADVKFGFFQKD